jgi:prepilin-type N-terminal cleavage/methylation domain-containing protein/prepilin-type processing-associated H-X9-DG protein
VKTPDLSPCRRRSVRHAFTLVELLVVIGIIAVLISILLPSLQSARRSAETVKCLSALRQLGLGFQLYHQSNKGAMPVGRQDREMPDGTIVNADNLYWQDLIMPYVSKMGKMAGDVANRGDFETARNSVMWGCPSWQGWQGQDSYTFTFGVSRFENGYTMNIYPTCEANYPKNGIAMPDDSEWQMRWFLGVGKRHKITRWTRPAERMLMVDANLWHLSFLASPGPISPQYVFRKQNDLPGSSNIDRYRHGKYPGIIGSGATATLDPKGGRVKFNILYVDGHAATVNSYLDGYKAVRMRDPGR